MNGINLQVACDLLNAEVADFLLAETCPVFDAAKLWDILSQATDTRPSTTPEEAAKVGILRLRHPGLTYYSYGRIYLTGDAIGPWVDLFRDDPHTLPFRTLRRHLPVDGWVEYKGKPHPNEPTVS